LVGRKIRTVYGKYFPKTVLLLHTGYLKLYFQWHRGVVIAVKEIKGIRA
jgi:hypothetical protein